MAKQSPRLVLTFILSFYSILPSFLPPPSLPPLPCSSPPSPNLPPSPPSDPYVKVNLYQGKKRVSKKKAPVKKCTPNPVFNDVFVFDLPSDGGLRDTSVELLLLDSERARGGGGGGGGDSHGSKPVLGRLVLGTDAPGTPGQHWREICEHPRRQIAKWHAMLED